MQTSQYLQGKHIIKTKFSQTLLLQGITKTVCINMVSALSVLNNKSNPTKTPKIMSRQHS